MAGLVSRIKEKVHHRRSDSGSSATSSPRNDHDDSRVTGTATPGSPSTPDRLRTNPRVSLESSAFHVTSSGGARSHEAAQDPYQTAYADRNAANQSIRVVSAGNHGAAPTQHGDGKELGRSGMSPMTGRLHQKGTSREEQQAAISDIVPGRESSKHAVTGSPGRHQYSTSQGSGVVPPRKPLSDGSASDQRRRSGVGSKQISAGLPAETGLQQAFEPGPSSRAIDGHEPSSQPSTSTGARLAAPFREESFSLNGVSGQATNENTGVTYSEEHAPGGLNAKPLPRLPSNKLGDDGHLASDAQLAQEYLSTDRDRHMAEKEKARAVNSGHLNLPPGFNLRDTEETSVTEEQRPAVVHETIVKERTEIVQEAITRDIHIHHYYTYLQPVRVVEVLPARHYFLDLQTGTKTEVLPPPGWQMPVSMAPVVPDTSMVKATTRHYLVDEEHPHGVLESPPLKHEQGHDNLRQQAVG